MPTISIFHARNLRFIICNEIHGLVHCQLIIKKTYQKDREIQSGHSKLQTHHIVN